ncbi:mitochondrial inner membrane protease ATP23 homolog [Clavelina lepadiformis]|uniref:mitochondrial inner membrane protease ATP23 homolog n=1 Tax=Clavelina lepadiformis TaxID=159417 RepID=UPI004041B05F
MANEDAASEPKSLPDFFNRDVSERRAFIMSMITNSKLPSERLETTLITLKKVLSEENPVISTLFSALADSGCAFNFNKHILIENCNPNLLAYGLFDSQRNRIVLCQNMLENIPSDSVKYDIMKYLLSFQLVHAFDHCRANADFFVNPKHDMCSAIRGASLSGLCMFNINKLMSTFSGFKSYHQKCVKDKAFKSFHALYGDWSDKDIKKLLDEVFPSCYNDHSPFDRIPLTHNQAKMSYKAYQTRNRYNIEE